MISEYTEYEVLQQADELDATADLILRRMKASEHPEATDDELADLALGCIERSRRLRAIYGAGSE